MHIIFVSPKDDTVKYEDVKSVIVAMTDIYCSFNINCWCVDRAGTSEKIRNALKRTGMFDRCVVFALNGNWASSGLSEKVTNWLKEVIYLPVD